MKTLKQFLKKIAVRQLLAFCLVSLLLLTGTACSSAQAKMPSAANPNNPNPARETRGSNRGNMPSVGNLNNSRPQQDPTSSNHDLPRAEKLGQSEGMYPHSDTERDTSAANAKANQEIKEAEQRSERFLNSGGYLDAATTDRSASDKASGLGESARQVGESTQRAANNAAENTKQSFSKLKDDAQEAVEQAADAVRQNP